MSFEERLHPRGGGGKFSKGTGGGGRGRLGDMRVTTRERNGPAVDKTPDAAGKDTRSRDQAYNDGPKDSPMAELMAAKAVQMHRWDPEAGKWSAQGDPVSPETAFTLARNAITHKQQVRLTVAKK